MGTQHAHRVVVKNEYLYTESRYIKSVACTNMHAQQVFNKWNRMHVHVTMLGMIYSH